MKVLKRMVYGEILGWKNTLADKYALLLEGARRVGIIWWGQTLFADEMS